MSRWLDDYHEAERRYTGPIPRNVRKLFEAQMSAAEYTLAQERARLHGYERDVAKIQGVYIPQCQRRIAEFEAIVKGQQEKAAG